MRNHILSVWAIVALVGCFLTSCMGDDDETSVELSRATYITAFSLNNVRRTMHTKDLKGEDSTYIGTYTAAAYAFSIDHVNKVITNPEPLLFESKLEAVLCNITASGMVGYHVVSDDPNDELNNDEWTPYSSSDSINLSRPVVLRVWSTDGAHWRDYRLKVNVYEKDPKQLTWTHAADCQQLAGMNVRRACVDANGLCVMGTDKVTGGVCRVYPLDETPQIETLDGLLDFDWSRTGLSAIDALLDAGSIDSDPMYLPTTCVSGAKLTNTYGVTRYVLAGLRDSSYEDKYAVVWNCVENSKQLIYNSQNNSEGFALPALQNLQVVGYCGRFVAFGGSLDKIYVSSDYGTTWRSDTDWKMPSELEGHTEPIAVASVDSEVYLVCGTQVWKMKSNEILDK